MRQQAVLQSRHHHGPELQSLGAVQGHQRDPLLGLQGVEVGHQGDVIEEGREEILIAGVVAVGLGELLGRGEELLDVLHPRLVLRIVLLVEVHVGGRLQQAVEQGGEGQVGGRLLEPHDQVAELAEGRGAAGRQVPEVVQVEDVPERLSELDGAVAQQLQGGLADPPRRLVDDPHQREVVARIA